MPGKLCSDPISIALVTPIDTREGMFLRLSSLVLCVGRKGEQHRKNRLICLRHLEHQYAPRAGGESGCVLTNATDRSPDGHPLRKSSVYQAEQYFKGFGIALSNQNRNVPWLANWECTLGRQSMRSIHSRLVSAFTSNPPSTARCSAAVGGSNRLTSAPLYFAHTRSSPFSRNPFGWVRFDRLPALRCTSTHGPSSRYRFHNRFPCQ